MWHKAEWMGRPMCLEFPRVGLLVELANRYTTIYIYIYIYIHTHTSGGVTVSKLDVKENAT